MRPPRTTTWCGPQLGRRWRPSLFATWFGAETCVGAAGQVYPAGLQPHGPTRYTLCARPSRRRLRRAVWRAPSPHSAICSAAATRASREGGGDDPGARVHPVGRRANPRLRAGAGLGPLMACRRPSGSPVSNRNRPRLHDLSAACWPMRGPTCSRASCSPSACTVVTVLVVNGTWRHRPRVVRASMPRALDLARAGESDGRGAEPVGNPHTSVPSQSTS